MNATNRPATWIRNVVPVVLAPEGECSDRGLGGGRNCPRESRVNFCRNAAQRAMLLRAGLARPTPAELPHVPADWYPELRG